MFYRSQAWSPTLIIAQIVTLQCIFYLTFASFLYLLLGPYVSRIAFEHCLSPKHLSFQSFSGCMVITSSFLTGLVCAGAMVFVVERAKKCLDFSATIYILHLLVVTAYEGFPTAGTWWLVNAVDLAVVALLSEWLCVQRELQDIPVGVSSSRRGAAGGQHGGLASALFGSRGSVASSGAGVQLATMQRTPLPVVPEEVV